MAIQEHTHTFNLPTVPDWQSGGWSAGVAYSEGAALLHNGSSYQVLAGAEHTSTATDEPGVGANWQTVWRVIASSGSDGDGFTGGSYDNATGVVTLTSDDGLGFSTGDLRGAALNPRGDYDIGTPYAIRDSVTDQGSTWIALQATTGNAPPTLPTTSNAYWTLGAERGTDGLPEVADRTALKALDETTFQLAYLVDDAVIASYDATVPINRMNADPTEQKYVSDDRSSPGAWILNHLNFEARTALNEALNVRPFESVPQPDDSFRNAQFTGKVGVGEPYNLQTNSDDLTAIPYNKIDGASIGSGRIPYQGHDLFQLTGFDGGGFTCGIRDLGNSAYSPRLVAGQKYIVSVDVWAPFDDERFFWMRQPVSGSSEAHGAKLIGRTPRRVHEVVTATDINRIDGMLNPAVAAGSGTSTFIRYFAHANSGEIGSDIPTSDVYIGKPQVELAPNQTEKCGIALIGTSIDTTTSTLKHPTIDRSWPRYFEGLLSVPIFNKAIGGQNSTQMEARFDTDVTPVAVNAEYCVLCWNVNDFTTLFDSAVYRANFASMTAKAEAAGMTVIHVTPQRTSILDDPPGAAAKEAEIQFVKDTYERVIDRDLIMQDPIYQNALNETYGGDGVHSGKNSNKAFAKAVFARYGHLFQFDNVPKPYQEWTADYGDLPLTQPSLYVGEKRPEVIDFPGSTTTLSLLTDRRSLCDTIVFTGARTAGLTVNVPCPNYAGTAADTTRAKITTYINATDQNVRVRTYSFFGGSSAEIETAKAPLLAPGEAAQIFTNGAMIAVIKGT